MRCATFASAMSALFFLAIAIVSSSVAATATSGSGAIVRRQGAYPPCTGDICIQNQETDGWNLSGVNGQWACCPPGSSASYGSLTVGGSSTTMAVTGCSVQCASGSDPPAVTDPCASVMCDANALCNGGTCSCNTGFSGDGTTCTVDDPCASVTCDANAQCVSGTCTCNSGYTGDGTICTADDPCASVTCDSNAQCISGTCTCSSGYTGDGTTCTADGTATFQVLTFAVYDSLECTGSPLAQHTYTDGPGVCVKEVGPYGTISGSYGMYYCTDGGATTHTWCDQNHKNHTGVCVGVPKWFECGQDSTCSECEESFVSQDTCLHSWGLGYDFIGSGFEAVQLTCGMSVFDRFLSDPTSEPVTMPVAAQSSDAPVTGAGPMGIAAAVAAAVVALL